MKNTKLIQHGIQTEDSDIRAHVSVSDNSVYVFSTKKAVDVISRNKFKETPVYSDVKGSNIQTATGYLVPVKILKPRIIRAQEIIAGAGFVAGGYSSTSDKGKKAQNVICELLKRGLFPLPTNPLVVNNVDMQKSGFDLIVKGRWKIEVKCDWRIGDTGNIFLQIAECNPLGQY